MSGQPARTPETTAKAAMDLPSRIEGLDWSAIGSSLDDYGCAVIGPLLSAQDCAALAASYDRDAHFRSHIHMARHGFGRGEYKYFAYPLPEIVAALRAALYPPLADIANRWNEAMGIASGFPPITPPMSASATMPARPGRRRFSCIMALATIIACIRIFTASWCSRSRSPSSCLGPDRISPAANSC